ncbi:hypothetical protein [Hydrocoleum sp. CS-953]|nr:hypothetical protein [Hydrocoleum sp. CS-953]
MGILPARKYWGDEEMGRWADGQMGRWADGQISEKFGNSLR